KGLRQARVCLLVWTTYVNHRLCLNGRNPRLSNFRGRLPTIFALSPANSSLFHGMKTRGARRLARHSLPPRRETKRSPILSAVWVPAIPPGLGGAVWVH